MSRLFRLTVLLWLPACGRSDTKARAPGSAVELPTSDDTGDSADTAPPADGGEPEPETDPWPDAATLPDGVVSVVYEGAVLSPGQTVAVPTPPAGLPELTPLRFVVTNRTDDVLSLPADGAAWLSGDAFSWVSPPPTALAPEESAALELSVDVSDETAAVVHSATLTVPGGPELTLEAHVPRPLRVVVVGSGRYTAVSDSYGAAYETELHEGDESTARDVVWGGGRFLRADRATDDWSAPGEFQWSDDGLTWHDATTSEEFWVSDCTHAWDRFYCVRESSWTSSDDGTVVLHDANGWGQLLNGVAFVPGDEVDRADDTTDPGALFTGDRLVAVGRAGRRMLSADGASWTADVSSSTTSAFFNAVTYADGLVVAVGGTDSLEAAVSRDGGETWTESLLCSDRYAGLWTVVHGNGIFLASGQSNSCDQIWRSTDGETWEGISRDRVIGLAFTNGWFIGVAQPWGQPAALLRSTDGLTWDTVHTVPEGVSIQAAAVETWSAP